MFLLLLLFAWTVKTTDNPHVMLCVWPLELGIRTHNPCTSMCGPLSWGYGLTISTPIQDAHHATCVAIFRVFLGKRVKGRFPLQKFIRPSLCPNPNLCVPKPKPKQMHSPESDGTRHPGKHSPQSDGSRHRVAGGAAKVTLHEFVFSAGAASSSTLVCLHRPLPFCLVDMPAKKAKKTPEEKRLLVGPCHVCEKKGCQMACLHCGIAFHPHCGKHDIYPNAPAQDNDDEQDMRGVGPLLAPCEGRCGCIYANTGECGCTEDMCGCRQGSSISVISDMVMIRLLLGGPKRGGGGGI